jgi:hypothetical protein
VSDPEEFSGIRNDLVSDPEDQGRDLVGVWTNLIHTPERFWGCGWDLLGSGLI